MRGVVEGASRQASGRLNGKDGKEKLACQCIDKGYLAAGLLPQGGIRQWTYIRHDTNKDKMYVRTMPCMGAYGKERGRQENRTTGKAENERITGQALAAAARMARPAAGKYFI